MSATIKVAYDNAQLRKALEEDRKNWGEVEAAVVALGGTVDRETRKQIRQAEAVIRSHRSEEEILQQKIDALEVYGTKGKEQAEKAQRAIKRLKEEHIKNGKEAAEAAKKGTKAYKDQQEQVQKGVSKVKDLVKASRTLEDEHRDMQKAMKAAYDAGKIGANDYNRGLTQLQNEYIKLKAKQKDAVGSNAIAQVGKFATSFIGIASAINVVREALEFFNQEREKALGSTESLEDVRRSLRQVSKGDFGKLEKRADSLTEFGIDRVQARQLVFDARSTGFEGEENVVAAANPVIKIEDGSAFAGEFRKYFSDENLSIEQAFNTALAGAAESQFNITQLLPQVRKAAQGQLAGGESSDVVAATGVLATDFGESTGDRLRALGVKLATHEKTRGKNLIEAVDMLYRDPELRQEIQKDSSELKSVISKFFDRGRAIIAADKRIEIEQSKIGKDGLLGKKLEEVYDTSTEAGRIAASQLALKVEKSRTEIRQERDLSVDAAERKTDRLRSINDVGTDRDRVVGSSLNPLPHSWTRAYRSFVFSTLESVGIRPNDGGLQTNQTQEILKKQLTALEGIHQKSGSNTTIKGVE